jgi:hypothetical protein
MRNPLKGSIVSIVGLVGLLAFSTGAMAQSSSILNKLAKEGTGGPAPKRDLTGFWGGNVNQNINKLPPMTPWGLEVFHTHKSSAKYPVAESNDPLKTCDPLGFPMALVFESRGIAFTTMPDRVIQLFQYDKTWREIFTDGRPLPNNVGATTPGAPDPRYWGYSVGHWDGDYTFVVDTTGTTENTWLDRAGDPHSVGMFVEERWTRLDHNDLEVIIKVNDPKAYTAPFVLTTAHFRWIPKQDFEEQICVGSEELDYLKLIANPAINNKKGDK